MRKFLSVFLPVLFCFSLMAVPVEAQTSRPKILYVDSYSPDFAWVRDIMKGMARGFGVYYKGDHFDDSRSDVDLEVFHMDTKTHQSEEYKKDAALRAKRFIDAWQPDILIISDDNAAKYLVVPYLMDSSLPILFCGINWDAGPYGFPNEHITGMVEVTLVPQTLAILQKYAQGSRIGVLGSDTLTERKNVEHYQKIFDVQFHQIEFAEDFLELKGKFSMMQENNDILLLLEMQSVKGFDNEEMKRFVQQNTKIITGSMDTFLAPYVVVSCAKKGQEQGEWVAQKALEILQGKSPSDIPLARNKEAKILLNMHLAQKLGIKFSMDLITRAEFVNGPDH